MKIFTLLQNLLKMLTGQTGRNFPFNTPNAQRATPNAERRTPNAERRTPNAERRTPNLVLHSNKSVQLVNASVQNMMDPKNDAFVSIGYKILPEQNAEVSGSDEKHSVEYKILPVQKKITSVQKIKPVFMQNFFAIVKKIFSLSDHPETLLENLNDGYHPGCHYGTANTQNISLTNQHHDVANEAASFALIPLPLTPTAMNHSEKKSVKTITGRSGIFGMMMLMSSLFFVSTAFGQVTKTWALSSGGTWGTANNWSPSGAPATNDNVVISGNLSSAITGVPGITLTNLTINGNCNFTSTNGPTMTVTGAFSVPAGITFSLGTGGTSTPRLNLTLSSTSVSSVLGTVNINTGGTDVTFTNNGDLTVGSAGLITSTNGNGNSNFSLSNGAKLTIGSTGGITTTGATGNIRVDGTRTYSTGANYIYNGTAAQTAGNGLTQGTPASLTINNSAGVSLSATTTVSGSLTMTSGTLNLADLALTLGALTGSGNISNATGGTTPRTITIGSSNTSTTYSGVISNGTNTGGISLTKTGTGTLTLSGLNSYSGATNINAGILQLGASGDVTNSPLGTITGATNVASGAALDLNGFTLLINETLSLNGTGITAGGALINSSATAVTFHGLITLAGASSILANAGDINLDNAGTITGAFGLTLGGSGNGSISSIIGTSAGSVTMSGTGVWNLNGANTYSGATTINSGELRLNPSVITTQTSPVVLNGGTLGTTNIASGISITNSTLNLNAGANTINLGSNPHSILFANSSEVTWNGTSLTVNGWNGTAGQSNVSGGKIFFGNTIGTLTTAQLNKISFTGFSGTPIILIGTGEIVPQPLTPLLIITGPTNVGNACVGSPTSPIQYTITNNGAVDANDIAIAATDLISPSAQFTVGSLSSPTIPANGGTATFNLIFNPASAGGQSGELSATSSTVGSNSPVLDITGTGVAVPVATFSYPNGSYCQALITNPNPPQNPSPQLDGSAGTFSATKGGNPTTDLVFISTSGANAGQIDLKNSLPGTYIVTNTVISANCTITATTQVVINPLPTLDISYAQPAYCNTDATAEPIIFNPSDLTGLTLSGYSVIPSTGLSIDANGAITPSLSTPGNYKVILSFIGGSGLCPNTDTAFVTITQMASGTISYGATPTYCQNFGIVNVTNGITGATTGATFSAIAGLSINATSGAITTSTSTPSLTPYTVSYMVPAIGGCLQFTTTAPVTISDTTSTTISYGGSSLCTNSGTITPAITGLTGGTFSSSSGNLPINTTTGVINPTIAGNYTVTYTATSPNGCVSTPKILVTVVAATNTPVLNTAFICTNTTTLNISLPNETSGSGTPISVLDNGVVVATFNRNGTTNNYTFTPSPAFQNGDVITITAQATGKCISTPSNSVTVGLPAQPSAINGSPTACPNTTGTYSVTSVTGLTYTFAYNGSGVNISGGTSASRTLTFTASATSGDLTVTPVSCANGTPQTLHITVNPAPPSIPGSITGLALVCTGASQTYSVSPVTDATNYTWTLPADWIPTSGVGTPSITATTGAPTNGTITVSASNSCGIASSAATAGPTDAGLGTSVTGIGTVAWTAPNEIASPGGATATLTVPAGGTTNYLRASNYGFNIPTNATITGITVIINRDNTSSALTSDNTVRLVDASGAMTGTNFSTGGTAQGWSTPNLGTVTYGGAANLWGGSWSPTIINNSNFGVQISATSTSGSTRVLNVDYIRISISYTVPPVSSLAVTVNDNPSITLANGSNATASCNNSTTADLAFSGTTGSPDRYSIVYDQAGFTNVSNLTFSSTPITLTIPSGLPGGTYTGTLTVTNHLTGCISPGVTFSITIPDALTATTTQTDNLCFGGTSGIATVIPAGGNGTYTINWTGPNGFTATNQASISGLAAGTYNYSLTDGNNCGPITGSVTIAEATQVTANASAVDNECFGGLLGSITVTPGGGNGVYSINLTGPNGYSQTNTNSTLFENLAAGTYTYTVTDGNGCTSIPATINVNQGADITATIAITDACSGGLGGMVTITPGGGTGTGPGDYFIFPTDGGPAITPEVATAIDPGTWHYTIINGTCAKDTFFTVGTSAAIAVDGITQTTIGCNGGSATVTITAHGGNSALSYTFDGQTNSTGVFTHSAGSGLGYSVTDANNCSVASGTFDVVQPAVISISGISQSEIGCQGGTATVTIIAAGGTGTLSYTFDGETNNTGIFTHAAGAGLIYSVTDANNCNPANGTFDVVQPETLTLNGVTQSPISCFGDNATVTIATTGGTEPLTYTFDGETNATGIFTHAAGTALVYSVTDANNCSVINGTFDVVQPPIISITGISQSTIDCNGESATVTITATGGTGTLTYTFDGQSNNTGIFTHAAGTGLSYSVTDANNCVMPGGTFDVVEPAIIAVSNVEQTPITCNGGSATVTITAAGGTGALSYTFDGETNSTGIFTHAAGTGLLYSVTDANGCTAATGTFDVLQPPVISISDVSQSAIDCNGGSATVTITATGGTAPLSYTFDGQTNLTGIFTHAAGTGLLYSVTDANNCVVPGGTFDVVEPVIITVSDVTQTPISCNGGSATVTITAAGGTGALSYTFDGQTNSTGIFTHAAGTGLLYSVTDANGCSPATGTFDVVQPTTISVSDISQSLISCNGGTATVTITATGGTAPLSYTFDGVTNATGIFTHVAGTGLTYSVTDVNGCDMQSGTFDVVEPPIISITNVTQSTIDCNGGSSTVTITATGGTGALSYTLDGVINTTGIFTHLAGTGIIYNVTDANHCVIPGGTIDILQPDAITISNISQTPISCFNGTSTVIITATGGTGALSYTFDGVTNANGIFTHTAGANLAYSVTDSKNCTPATGSLSIIQPNALSVANDGSSSNVSCFGGSDGSIILGTVSGGTPPYAFSWTKSGDASFSATTANISNLGVGTYSYTLTDANNCSLVSGVAVITQPDPITVASDGSKTDVSCNGGTNGSITLGTVSGGTAPYTYSWTTSDGIIPANQQHVANPTGLTAGTYSFSVSDQHNCSAATGSVTIGQPAVLSATFTSNNITCFNAANGTATITVTGGTPIYQYNIDGNGLVGGSTNDSRTFTGLAPGGHTVVVTDNHGCTTSVTFTLTQPTQLTAIASAGTVSCNSSTTSLFVIASGGTAPYMYSLNGGIPQPGFVFTVGAGSYVVTVTDANSCTVNTAAVGVANPTQMTIDITGVTPSGCSGATGSFNVSASGGSGSYTYSLNGGGYQPSGSFTGLAANTYLVSAKDGNGCTVSGIVTINGGTPPTAFNVTGGGSSCTGTGFPVGLSNAQAGVTYFLLLNNAVIGSMPPANILPGFAFSFGNQTAPGVYTVIASNPATGCIATMSGSATITSGTPPTAFTVTGGGSYCNGAGLPIGLSNSQTGVSYQLVIDGTNTGSPINGNGSAISFGNQTAVGSYTVVATNASGCTGNMSNAVSITGGSLPTPFTVTSGPDNCTGLGVHIGLAASQLNVSYQLYFNGAIDGAVAPVAGGNGSPIDFGPQHSGTYTVVATTSAGCTAEMTGSVTVHSTSIPTAYMVTGGGSYCSGGNGLHVGLQNSESGVTYQLFNGAAIASGLFPGSTGSQIDFGVFQAGTYTVVATNASGCTNNMAGNATISLTPSPIAFNLVAPNGVNDCSGSGVDIQLSGSESGVSYQLYLNEIAMGSLIPGTGNLIDLGNKQSGTYTIVGISNTGGCTGNMSNSVIVNAGAKPTAFTVTGGGNFCSGPGLPIGLSNSETGVNYVLILNGTTNVGFATGTSGNSISFGNQTANGSYSVLATNTNSNCTNQMANTVSISAGAAPTAFNVTGTGSYCTGGPGVKVGLSSSETGVAYQLFLNGNSSGAALLGNGSALDFGFQTAGTYTVQATNSSTGCTNNMTGSAIISINNATASINTQPLSQAFCGSVQLSVDASNATGFQWFNGASSIAGANNPTYTATAAGSYTVVVSGLCGAPVTSNAAVLTEIPVVSISTQPVGGAFCGSVQLSVSASGATGYQWFNGASSIAGANNPTYTATAAGSYTVVVSGACGAPVTSDAAVLTTSPAATINTQPVGGSFCGSIQLSVSASGATGYQWFKGVSSIAGANNPTYTATSAGSYTVVVSGACGAPVTSDAAVLTTPAPVSITTQPQSQTFTGNVILSVGASNVTGYQWYNGATLIPGATNPTYTATAAGTYHVVVSGMCGSQVTSADAVLSTCASVTIITQPLTQSFCGSVQLSVSANNASGYQWKKGSNNIIGANNSTYTATSAGSYTVVVSGNCGSPVTSNPAVLTANASVAITTQPVNKSICSGGSATLSVTASNANGYQWFRGNNSISGANSPSYTTSTSGNYKVVVSGNCGSPVTSNTVSLSVNAGVTIVTQPVSTQICAGGTESFSVVATGATGYQWYRNSNLIIGATNAQYFTGTTGRYDCRVFDACGGSVMSDFAFLTINGPVAITSQPQSQTMCSGGTATFTVGANNANGFQWYRNNSGIPGAVNTSYTTNVAGNYKVVVRGGCGGPITSNTATLSFFPAPSVAGINGTGTICTGTTVRFTDATSGGTWSSSDVSVATVSATGFVRGVSGGTATIRYTISNGCSTNTATRNITVNGVPVVQDITGNSSVCPGSTIQLSDGTANGDWNSSNTSVATVNNNGRVRGIRNGNVTISYTVQNSCGSKTVSTPIAVSCSGIQKNSLAATNDVLTLDVSVSPNPSQNFFTLIAQSSVLDAPITISIFDMRNRLVDRHTAGVGEAVRFGDRFAAGMYIVQVTQGSLQKTVKVVKN